MDSLVTVLIWLLAEPAMLYLLVPLAAIVVAGMSVYGMTQALKAKKGNK